MPFEEQSSLRGRLPTSRPDTRMGGGKSVMILEWVSPGRRHEPRTHGFQMQRAQRAQTLTDSLQDFFDQGISRQRQSSESTPRNSREKTGSTLVHYFAFLDREGEVELLQRWHSD